MPPAPYPRSLSSLPAPSEPDNPLSPLPSLPNSGVVLLRYNPTPCPAPPLSYTSPLHSYRAVVRDSYEEHGPGRGTGGR